MVDAFHVESALEWLKVAMFEMTGMHSVAPVSVPWLLDANALLYRAAFGWFAMLGEVRRKTLPRSFGVGKQSSLEPWWRNSLVPFHDVHTFEDMLLSIDPLDCHVAVAAYVVALGPSYAAH